jgi:hypothetical protein
MKCKVCSLVKIKWQISQQLLNWTLIKSCQKIHIDWTNLKTVYEDFVRIMFIINYFLVDWSQDWNESSYFIKILFHFSFSSDLTWDWELSSHRDLISSHLMKKNLISFWFCLILVSFWDEMKHLISCQEMLLFYNIYINIRSI